MKLLEFSSVLLIISSATAAPATNVDDDKITITSEFFDEQLVVYKSEHDIVSIAIPLNSVNFDDDSDDTSSDNTDITIYFVEADIKPNGDKDYKGLYSLRNGKATKVLDDGTGATAANDDTTEVYFSSKDGIYVFNSKTNKTEKYGTVTDTLISIAKVNGSDILYVLTEDHDVYKVTEGGTKKEKLENVHNAKEIALDYSNNLYYYSDKTPYVVTEDGVKKFDCLPENPNYVEIIKPPFIVENGVIFASDDKVYAIYFNGTCEETDFVLQLKPTAYAPEGTLIQYYGYNKKIYEYNILSLILGTILDELKSFLEDKADVIQSLATRSRSELAAN